MKCRHCQTELKHEFIDLFNSPPSNSYINPEDLNKEEVYFPLKVWVCDNCWLVQLDEFKSATEIFSEEYVYFSSYSTTWLAHSKAYVDMMTKRFGYNENSLVVEVASNDGYLLQYFHEKGIPVIGVEPSSATAAVAREKGIESITEFFGEDFAKGLAADRGKADLILGNNVLAHVPDINDFVKGAKALLKDDGVITFEFPHLANLVADNQFDTIYHEHFSYLSLTSVQTIFKAFGLEVFDVEEIPTHGGSLRVFGCHSGAKTIEDNVATVLAKENDLGVSSLAYYEGFQAAAAKIKFDFIQFLLTAKAEGKKVAAYGAAAKGNTLLNYCGLKSDLIEFVVDRSPHKQGKLLPGAHIPIVHEDRIKEFQPDYIIIFPWNLKTEITEQLSYAREWNAKFVIAIPELQVL